MKRFTFLSTILGLAGAAKAQVLTKPCVRAITTCLAVNNRCPVCGTMAEPLTLPRTVRMALCPPGSDPITACIELGEPSKKELAELHLTYCAHCNAAFGRRGE